MEWLSPFIVYRVDPSGSLVEVFHTNDLKKAKYWLTYIAEAGDVLCRTPAHPRYENKVGAAEYIQHKLSGGKLATSFEDWVAESRLKNFTAFPKDQMVQPSDR